MAFPNVTAVRGGTAVQSATVIANTYRLDMVKADAAGVSGVAWTTKDGARGGVVDVLPPDLGCND